MGWWAWGHSSGREEVGGLEGSVGTGNLNLVNKSAENISMRFCAERKSPQDYRILKNIIEMFFVDIPCQDPYSAETQLVLQCQVVVLPWIGLNLHLEGQE